MRIAPRPPGPENESAPTGGTIEALEQNGCTAESTRSRESVKQTFPLSSLVAAGMRLVPIPSGAKGPTRKGWNLERNCVLPDGWTGNVGLAHAYSGTCAIDFDNLELATTWLAERGIDAQALLNAPDAVRISSGRPNRAKLIYRIPTPHASLKLFGGALELRCASKDGATVQDVIPPSIHPDTGQPYVWEYDELFADPATPPLIPDALLALWDSHLAAERAPATPATFTASELDNYSHLQALLAQLDPSAPYDASDQLSWLKVGMALHHETNGSEAGLDLWDAWSAGSPKYISREDLASHWRSFKPGGGITLQYLQQGTQAPVALFQPIVEMPTAQTLGPEKPSRFTPQRLGEFVRGKPPRWLVRDVLPQAELAVLYGASGSGKSFVALDLAAAIARGEPWRGLRVARGPVLYVVGEGVAGFRQRAIAYCREHGIDPDALDLHIASAVPSLVSAEQVQEAARVFAPLKPVLIVIDTLARALQGADENSGEDMGKAIAHCAGIHAATGSLVLLVHHSGKDESRGARGWSGLRAAADAELEVTRLGDTRTLAVTKQKDGNDEARFAFRLRPVPLGQDEEGEDVTSAVVEHVDAPAAVRLPKGALQRRALAIVEELQPLGGGATSVATVITTLAAEGVHDPEKRDTRRQHARRALDGLAQAGFLVVEGDTVRVAAVH